MDMVRYLMMYESWIWIPPHCPPSYLLCPCHHVTDSPLQVHRMSVPLLQLSSCTAELALQVGDALLCLLPRALQRILKGSHATSQMRDEAKNRKPDTPEKPKKTQKKPQKKAPDLPPPSPSPGLYSPVP